MPLSFLVPRKTKGHFLFITIMSNYGDFLRITCMKAVKIIKKTRPCYLKIITHEVTSQYH